MKNEYGITIISLVVTIIILIILAGITINLTIGEDGLVTKAKQAKENIELAQIEEQVHLNELYSSLETELSGEIGYDAIAKLTELKKAIADYIEEAGGIKPEYTAETTTFGDSIKGIVKEVTKNATATADNISEGKTAWINGELVTGNGADNDYYYQMGYTAGLSELENIDIVYTYHVHTGNSTNGGGCYTKDITRPENRTGTRRVKRNDCNCGGTQRHDYYCVHCSALGLSSCPGWPSCNGHDESYNYTVQVHDYWDVNCGKTEETIEEAKIVFN